MGCNSRRGHMAELPGSLSCPALPSQRNGELCYLPMLVSSPPRQPHSLTVPYLQDSRLVAEAREETMGLTWKELSYQLHRRTSLSSATSTHTSAEDSPAQLLQKLFLPALLEQPAWFCGMQSHRQSTCHGSPLLGTSFCCGMDLDQAALPRQDGSSHPLW